MYRTLFVFKTLSAWRRTPSDILTQRPKSTPLRLDGAAASALYTYLGGGSTDVSVPLYDIFGSTIDLIDPNNPSTFETFYLRPLWRSNHTQQLAHPMAVPVSWPGAGVSRHLEALLGTGRECLQSQSVPAQHWVPRTYQNLGPHTSLRDGGAVIGYQANIQNASFLTPPGGGAGLGAVHLYRRGKHRC